MRKSIFNLTIAVLILVALSLSTFSQTSQISYQGSLDDEGSPANGSYHFKFRLYNSGTFGSQLGNELTRTFVPVSDGIFSFNNLDFGIPFTNSNIWLEIDVRKGIVGSYTTLTPRQKVNSSPTSIRSLMAADTERFGGLLPSLFVRTNDSSYVRTNDSRLTDSRSPTSGSSFYIQNRTSEQSSSNFRVSGTGRATRFIANTDMSIGTTTVSNPLTVIGFGTDNGGVTGVNNVIARFRQRTSGEETAISIDSASNEDSILYLSEGGDSKYQIRHDTGDDELQIRRQIGASSTIALKIGGDLNDDNFLVTNGTFLVRNGRLGFHASVPTLNPASLPLCASPQGEIQHCVSSRRFKTNFENYRSGLDLIQLLRPVSYVLKGSKLNDFGLIAEEVAEVEPLLATYENDGRVRGVKYDRIGVVAVNAIKEQQTQIENLQKTIKKQHKEFKALKAFVCAGKKTAEFCK